MSNYLHRLAVFSARHRALVIGTWLVVLVALLAVSHQAGTKYSSSVTVSGSDSAAATDVMSKSFSAELSDTSPIVFHTDEGSVDRRGAPAAIEASVRALSQDPAVASVTDPFADGSTRRLCRRQDRLCQRGPHRATGRPQHRGGRGILDTASGPTEDAGVDVAAGGQLGTKISKSETGVSELVGILAAMLILLLVFGTVTAMVLPIATAIVGLIVGLSIVSLLGHAIDVPGRGADDRDDDRARRRHRLRPVHRHPGAFRAP